MDATHRLEDDHEGFLRVLYAADGFLPGAQQIRLIGQLFQRPDRVIIEMDTLLDAAVAREPARLARHSYGNAFSRRRGCSQCLHEHFDSLVVGLQRHPFSNVHGHKQVAIVAGFLEVPVH